MSSTGDAKSSRSMSSASFQAIAAYVGDEMLINVRVFTSGGGARMPLEFLAKPSADRAYCLSKMRTFLTSAP